MAKNLFTALLSGKGRIFTRFSRPISHLAFHNESEEEMICRFECLFNRPDLDGWDLRQGMNDLFGLDCVPDPRVINAALCACRRIDDYALTVRFLEGVVDKCGNKKDEIMPYIRQECGPTMSTLGCDWPECLGYDKPELWLEEVDEGMGKW